MRNWLIRKLGGVPKATFDRLVFMYKSDMQDWRDTVEKHKMYAAWEEQKKQGRRAH